MAALSLRLRLFGLILLPLVLMSALLGYWRFSVAQETAETLFDNNLLAAALAISRDVAISGGDALLPSTSDMIRDASGGEVFYHVAAPDGIYVTGYASPPIPDDGRLGAGQPPRYSQAIYRGEPVRVLQITERVTIENLTGEATVSVWQRLADRQAFANKLALRTAMLMGMLLLTLAVVIWFGVARGLRPLLDLQDAISARSPDDLSRIRRKVPREVQGIVETLNRLFGQVERSIEAHQVFISNAAHQLRNPAAAVQSLAESLRDVRGDADRDQRIAELVAAARNSTRVANQLLSLDRLHHQGTRTRTERLDLSAMVRETCAEAGPAILSQGIDLEVDAPDHPVMFSGDPVFLSEALKNLVDNAVKHGGPALSSIRVSLRADDAGTVITVRDDGKGLRPEDTERAFTRFSQIEPSDGSGLGLAIVRSVAERHDGRVTINRVKTGASLSMHLGSARTERNSSHIRSDRD
ncbi:MAG: sensor histidine kinase [Tropicimonas sp.]|uniref:sensor histidine kinase n=1 Tax=Tropicimonas sp. TaxID=2067044 RepID=UPI003A8868B0